MDITYTAPAWNSTTLYQEVQEMYTFRIANF